jgi:multidrug efflux pump subunit AcrA (membrane-fusion protein)
MLNLSPSNKSSLKVNDFQTLSYLEKKNSSRKLLYSIYALFFIVLVILFLPWTQNIQSNGKVTTLRPEQRPQTINTMISGRIEKWFVKDGDIVKKGDTILYISEIKEDYFDPNLISRTKDQLKNKEMTVSSYSDKIRSLDNRVDALLDNGQLQLQQAKIKLQQTELKIRADSIEYYTAIENN